LPPSDCSTENPGTGQYFQFPLDRSESESAFPGNLPQIKGFLGMAEYESQ
jgi:hypothetical protein